LQSNLAVGVNLREGALASHSTKSAWLDRGGEIKEVAGLYAETKIEELAERKLRFGHPELAQPRKRMTRIKTIALIDTRLEVPGVSLGILDDCIAAIPSKKRNKCRRSARPPRSDRDEVGWIAGGD
jgi:hypothetical protein